MGNDQYAVEILNIDEDGNLISRRAIQTNRVGCSAAYALPSGNLLIGGGGMIGREDCFALAYVISPVDTVLWQECWGGDENEYAEDMKLTSDGGCIIVGRTASFNANGWDFYAVRTGPIENVSAIRQDHMPPRSYSLAAYPNPFNPTTEISYELPIAEQVKLKVFDVLGREVVVLADGMVQAGSHAVTFDGSALPSGVYFARLQAGGAVKTEKMMLLR
jgi:hypothetical protein